MGGRSAREFYLVGEVSGDLTLLVGSMTLASAPGERDQEMLVTASAVFNEIPFAKASLVCDILNNGSLHKDGRALSTCIPTATW